MMHNWFYLNTNTRYNPPKYQVQPSLYGWPLKYPMPISQFGNLLQILLEIEVLPVALPVVLPVARSHPEILPDPAEAFDRGGWF